VLDGLVTVGAGIGFFWVACAGEGGSDWRGSGLWQDENDMGKNNDRAGFCGFPHLRIEMWGTLIAVQGRKIRPGPPALTRRSEGRYIARTQGLKPR